MKGNQASSELDNPHIPAPIINGLCSMTAPTSIGKKPNCPSPDDIHPVLEDTVSNRGYPVVQAGKSSAGLLP